MATSCARRVLSTIAFGSLCFTLFCIGEACSGQGTGGGVAAATASSARTREESPPTSREFRAAFVTTAYNFDWPHAPGNTETQQKNQIAAVVARAKEMNLNVIILQVRAFEDRIHKKTNHKEKFSRFVNNGQDPRGYDPLCEWIRVCHENGLELHAWVNPFRANGPKAGHPSLPNPFLWKKQWWYDPTDTKVHDRIIKEIAKELLDLRCKEENVNAREATGAQKLMMDSGGDGIDGMLIDHHFPEPPPDDPGKPSTGPATRTSTGGLTRTIQTIRSKPLMIGQPTIRQQKVSDFVEKLYDEVKQHGHTKFGISPDRDPLGNVMADVPTWLMNGWYHYMVPELYVRPGGDFDSGLEWYVTNNAKRAVPPIIVAGLMTTRVEKPESVFPTWPASDIEAEVVKSREIFDANKVHGGQAHYTYGALRSVAASGPPDNIGDLLKGAAYAEPALVPICVEAPSTVPLPSKPTFDPVGNPTGGTRTVSWGTSSSPWLWEFWARDKNSGNWKLQVLPAGKKDTTVPDTTDRIWLRAVDRYNRQGPEEAMNL